MKKLIRVKVAVIVWIVLLGGFFVVSSVSSAKLLEFPAILQIEVNQSAITVQPDGPAVSVPITVKYRVEVPPRLLQGMFGRWLVFGTFIVPPQKVHLSVLNKPDWANVAIVSPDIYVDIDTQFKEATTSLSISVYKNAPAHVYTLQIQAESSPLGKILKQTAEAQISVTPGYIPLINVYTNKPTREVAPQTSVNFPIEISNEGNKETIVTGHIVSIPRDWTAYLPQSQIVIPSSIEGGDNKRTVTLSVTPPYGFGWHNELKTITVDFVAQASPPGSSTKTGEYHFQVMIRNRGFSLPGFEPALLLIAFLFVSLIMKKRKNSEK